MSNDSLDTYAAGRVTCPKNAEVGVHSSGVEET